MSAIYADARTLMARMLRRTVRAESGCWIFTGATISTGYGSVGAGAKGKSVLTHRLVVLARDGGIPDGMTVDHTCHDSYTCGKTGRGCQHRRCVNPAHLAVVTAAVNTQRQYERGTCRKGHELSVRANGARRCRVCAAEYALKWRAERQAAAAPLRLPFEEAA